MSPNEQAIIDRFNTATNKIAEKLRAISPDDPEFNAKLEEIATGLEALGADGNPPPVEGGV